MWSQILKATKSQEKALKLGLAIVGHAEKTVKRMSQHKMVAKVFGAQELGVAKRIFMRYIFSF